MNEEELKQIIFLSEHGYYDKKVIKMANKNKPESIDLYELHGDIIHILHSGYIKGYYGQDNERIGRELLDTFRKKYIIKTFPEIKKLVEVKR